MRRWALSLILHSLVLAGITLPASAASRVTVAQLEQTLAASQTKSDSEVARQLAAMQLSERLSSSRLDQLRVHLPGEKSQQALTALADISAFLEPPPSDIPATATPDLAAQRRMLAMTVKYLGKTLPMLPNLFAARDTVRFETRPESAPDLADAENPLREAGKSRVTVLYRDGREFVDAGADKDKKAHAPDKGLTTWGEFGPILGTVLIDAAKSRMSWNHWELGGGGPEAVFRYAVAKEKSHYDVRFCCTTESYGFETSVVTERVGYHGEITIDPVSGTILRLTALADMGAGNPIGQADIEVEYGPAEIGGKTYFLPVRGIALAQSPDLKALHNALSAPTAQGSNSNVPTLQKASLTSLVQGPRQLLLNDVAFREYHLFRSESKLVSAGETAPGATPSATPSAAPSAENAAAAANRSSSPPANLPSETAVDSAALAAQPGAVAAASPADIAPQPATEPNSTAGPDPEAPDPEALIPEITVADAAGLPTLGSASQAGSDSAVTLRLSARLVDVPLVALDKKGRPITNLKPGDLEVYDEGHKVELRSFVQAGANSAQSAQTAAAASTHGAQPGPDHAYSNRMAAQPGIVNHDAQGNTLVLLIDTTISFNDLSNVREQLHTFLSRMNGDDRVALYVMRPGGYQVLQESTADHGLLASVLAKWTPSAQSMSLAQEQEARNRQSMDYVRTAEDLINVNGHSQTDATANQAPLDPNLRTLGDNPGRDAFSGLTAVAQHLAAIPGHKNLVWIASDNTLVDWTNGSINIDKGSRIIQASVLHAQEAMNDAHVSVYPLDASRLEAGGIDASIGTRNVALNPTATGNQGPGAACGNISNPNSSHTTAPELTNGEDVSTCQNDLRPGRATAQMQQDLRSIQGAYRELADATGGRTFRRANDMVSEFNSVAADGRATYLLTFTPPLTADNKYHLINIKVAGRKDITLRYRTGFFYRAEPSTLEDRFSQAILDPADATGIALTADPVAGSKGHTFMLGIAATDLAIAQQDDFWTDKLDVYVVQRELSGDKARVTGQTMGLRLKPATYQRYLHDSIPFNQVLEPSTETGSVRIVVVDENSGRMGSVTIPAADLAAKP